VKAWKIILAAAIIFVAGAVTGTVVYTQLIQKKVQQQRPVNSPSSFPRPDFWKWMGDRLELSQDQRDKINQIVTDSHERLKPLRELIDPIMQEELKRVNDEILKVLTPEQKKKYEEFLKRGPGRRPEGPPPGGFGPRGDRPPRGMQPDGKPQFQDRRFQSQSNRWMAPPSLPPQFRERHSTNQ
jgi:Spy/CpxP family protein refolding chaperone